MTAIKLVVILTVAALDFSIVSWSVWSDELVPDAKLRQSYFKQRWFVSFACGEPVCKFKSVVSLYAFNCYTMAFVPLDQSFGKIRRRISALFFISINKPQS